ncbi:MAG TPA: hypothetical protein VJ984_10540 [Xanthomonadales bacterium]|nr:hypothetical protein [Xanthomonadales bacterium]
MKLIATPCTCAMLYLMTPAMADESQMLINAGVGGGWYEPATDGQGFAFDVVPESNQLVAYWFTYPEAGGAREWYIAQGDINGDSASLVVYQTANGIFDQASTIDLQEVGMAFLTFHSCQSVNLDYQFDGDGAEGVIALQRLGSTRLCEQLRPGASLEAVSSSHSWVNLGGEWVFEGCVALGDNTSHGEERLEFSETSMTLEIDHYQSSDCNGPATTQTLHMNIQRIDQTLAALDGKHVTANRYILTDPASGMEIRQLWYVDDSGQSPLVSHGVLDSPADEDGFPTELHNLFFSRVTDEN